LVITKSNIFIKKTPVIVKEFASVTCTNYSLAQPYDFAIASSTRVQVYSHGTQTVKRTISRFKDTVSSCAFRADGKLLVAGDNGGLIQLFDVNSRAVLRTFEGQGAIKTIKYKYDKNQIISGSDDNTLKIWDIYKSDTPIYDFDEHTDYVRACNQSTENPHYILSGSYDHSLKMYDLREGNTVLSLDHGMPIESCLFLKGGSLVVSAGGNKIKLWDLLAGGKLVQTISHHQKTITSICLDGTGSFLFSASLDHQVKISSLHDYKLVHSIKYPAPILSMDVAPDNSQLAVGMTGGLLSIRKRVVKTADIVEETQPRGGTNKFFNRHGFGPSTVYYY
jgi:U3 small nucleolar RNA-associated protein 15